MVMVMMMVPVMDKNSTIVRFKLKKLNSLSSDDGYGCGAVSNDGSVDSSSDGSGFRDCYGSGSGFGSGSGSDAGSGFGSGFGDGSVDDSGDIDHVSRI